MCLRRYSLEPLEGGLPEPPLRKIREPRHIVRFRLMAAPQQEDRRDHKARAKPRLPYRRPQMDSGCCRPGGQQVSPCRGKKCCPVQEKKCSRPAGAHRMLLVLRLTWPQNRYLCDITGRTTVAFHVEHSPAADSGAPNPEPYTSPPPPCLPSPRPRAKQASRPLQPSTLPLEPSAASDPPHAS